MVNHFAYMLILTYHSSNLQEFEAELSSMVQIGSFKNLGFSLRKRAVSLILLISPSMIVITTSQLLKLHGNVFCAFGNQWQALVCFDAGNLNIRTISIAHSIHGLLQLCDDKNLSFQWNHKVSRLLIILSEVIWGKPPSTIHNISAGGSTDHS